MLERKIRIGVDAREFVGTTTGIARLFKGLLEPLLSLRPGWDFIFYGNSKTVFPFRSDNSRFIRLKEPLTPWWDQISVVRSLRQEKARLFLSPYYKVPLFAPCPVIHIVHDLIPLTNQSYRSIRYLIPRLALYVFGRLYTHKAQVTLTDSFYTRGILLKKFRLSDKKVHVVYPGIESRFSPPTGDHPFEQIAMKYRIQKPYLLYVGNFKPHKRVDYLVQAFRKLPEGIRKTTQLVLAGRRTPETKVLDRLVERLDLQNQVVFTGFVSEEDLPLLYGGAALFVFPSSDEGFGLPPLEAMACGVPVIASGVASLLEILGKAAILVEPGNAERLCGEMERLLRDPQERERRIRMGREHVKQFSIQSQCQAFLSILDNVLAGTQREDVLEGSGQDSTH